MKVVTSGLSFLDIDAYAGCIAYAELLDLQGIDAIAFSSANVNESVTRTIRSWNAPLVTNYKPTSYDSFILIDVSEPEYLEKIVDINRVEEVIDHHVGYEKFWEEKIGLKSNIEFIGAACTQVYESWVKAGLFDQMTEMSARLLVSGILDNTLNFKANVTTERDHSAYKALLAKSNLPDDWSRQYFEECESSIFADISNALVNDTKVMMFTRLDLGKLTIGQLVVWNGQRAISEYRNAIEETMAAKSNEWFVNVVSISDGRSLFLSSNERVARWASNVLGVKFHDGLANAERLWLRKEIARQDSQAGL
jgi:inorganic pyrophosphatase